MGFFSKVFGGLFEPKREPQPQPKPGSTGNKSKSQDISHEDGPKYSGREEETKAQKNADPETREIVKEAQEYPREDKPNPTADAAKTAGKTTSSKSPQEQQKTQPKPGAKQRKKPTNTATGKNDN
ncbi:hypothetical protein CWE09_01555 [Aliidiomarina minuta]|uniref:Uncharacterized protein n=1 Tax=Aliidiomarina minuta TaxID=880057 RepID=A0A432W643_9GAMM|nr:hypothetical protein [Aliidiomarina minuta]RUO25449.1 hypothetical protein CWE09_01555 [Aliidiomarina minuta]